jgi:hypothetical protein
MPVVPIPAWTPTGAIPPINFGKPADVDRSPYEVGICEFVLRFSSSIARKTILEGFLNYRAALHAVGLVNGFQWLDGSFLENIELLEGRSPQDIDVVTFYERPLGKSQRDLVNLDPALFPMNGPAHQSLKGKYHVDAYTEDLSKSPSKLVGRSAYWYSMWSHRRNLAWKGFVQVSLDPTDDPQAKALLANVTFTGGTP